jgi:hypothetical protein
MRLLRKAMAMTLLLSGTHIASANPFVYGSTGPGFVILAQQRFDPAVQRYLAEQSLSAMPLHNGQLYYIYPQNVSDQRLEEMQLQFMEALLRERRSAEQPDK